MSTSAAAATALRKVNIFCPSVSASPAAQQLTNARQVLCVVVGQFSLLDSNLSIFPRYMTTIIEGSLSRFGFREAEEKKNGNFCVVANGEVRDGPMRWGVLHAKRKSDDRSAQWSELVGGASAASQSHRRAPRASVSGLCARQRVHHNGRVDAVW